MEHEAELHFPARSTGQSQVVPDLMVLPPACELPAGMKRNREGRTVRLDEGHPLPEPVAEIVPPTSEVRDLEDKPARYAALGIVEYLACHPGDLPDPEADDPGSPAELRLFRLQPDGTYRQAMDAAAGFSRVCGTQVRLWQPNVRRMARPRGRPRRRAPTTRTPRRRPARVLTKSSQGHDGLPSGRVADHHLAHSAN